MKRGREKTKKIRKGELEKEDVYSFEFLLTISGFIHFLRNKSFFNISSFSQIFTPSSQAVQFESNLQNPGRWPAPASSDSL